MAASSQWLWVNHSLKLYTTYHVFGHFEFHWWCPYSQSSMQCTTYIYIYTCIYIYIYISLCLLRETHEYLWNSPHFMRWNLAYPWLGSNPRSLDYIPSSITRHVSDHQRKASQIYFYISGSPNKEIVYENDKNMNWICPMTAILNFTTCGKTVSFTAWHTAEMD